MWAIWRCSDDAFALGSASAYPTEHVGRGCLQSHLNAVRCLVKELGADVNKAREDSFTPLHIAAQQDHLNMVRCLVKGLEADVNKAMVGRFHAFDDRSPISRARSRSHGEELV